MKDFSVTLKNLRVERGLSQSDVAAMLGVARTTVAGYENGSRTPDQETLKRIAACFQVTTDFLLGTDTLKIDQTTQYADILTDINDLLISAPVTAEKKREILDEVRDYFRWKLEHAKNDQSSGEK